MAVLHEKVRGLPDFATLVKWDVSFSRTPGGLAVPNNFNFQCLSTDIPKTDAGQTVDVWIRGNRVRQPGIYKSTDTIEMAFAETVDNAISELIRSWRELCWETNTNVQGNRSDVEADILLTRLNRQNEEIWSYKLIGCFLEDYDPAGGQLDGENTEILRPTLTVSYDYFEDGPV